MKVNHLICIQCGKHYESQRSDSKYCGDACRVAFARREKKDGKTPAEPINWKDDDETAQRVVHLLNEVPRLAISIQSHYQRHGAMATRELVDALWRVYVYVSPSIKKPRLSQRQYYELWEHHVDQEGGFAQFWLPLHESGQHMQWLKEMYNHYGIDLRDVDIRSGYPVRA